MSDRWDGTIVTDVNSSKAARPTLMDWRLHIFTLSHSGRTGAGSYWGARSGSCASSCSGSVSLSAGGSVAPYTAATAVAVCLEGDDELSVHRCKLRRESRDRGRELCNGVTVTPRGYL